jgi:hypothetical protein
MLRRWRIDLTLLSDQEISGLEAFFSAQKGVFSPFTFIDPTSKMQISNCRFARAEMVSDYLGENSSSTLFWIIETNV